MDTTNSKCLVLPNILYSTAQMERPSMVFRACFSSF
jgi:hypothetical protein